MESTVPFQAPWSWREDEARALFERAYRGFEAAFGAPPDGLAFAPGRVNLIGEHTDYNGGFALPFALRQGTAVAFRSRAAERGRLTVLADDLGGARDTLLLAPEIPPGPSGWARYHRGVADAIGLGARAPRSIELWVGGDLPRGAGLSSSASLCLAIGLALEVTSGGAPAPLPLARAAQYAEQRFLGTQCGLLDQLAIALARPGHATLLDCQSNEGAPIPLPPSETLEFALIDSGIRRGLVDSAYNERRRECEAAAAALQLTSLRAISAEGLSELSHQLPSPLSERARHVVGENERTLAAAEALRSAALSPLAELLASAHRSLSEDFAVSLPEIDRLAAYLNTALTPDGGARMTGGGFGGALIVSGPPGLQARLANLIDRFPEKPQGARPSLLPCEVGAGSRFFLLSRVQP